MPRAFRPYEVNQGNKENVSSGDSVVSRLRARYRERLSSLQRGHFLAADQARTKLRTFRDYLAIRESLAALGGDPETVRVESVRAGNVSGYRLHCTGGKSCPVNYYIIVITDENGRIKRTLTSKNVANEDIL